MHGNGGASAARSISVVAPAAAPEYFERLVVERRSAAGARRGSGSATGSSTNSELTRLPSDELLRGVAEVHRHHRAQPARGQLLAAVESKPPQRRCVQAASTTSLTEPPSSAADRLQLRERDAHDREPARLADRHVERGVRRADQLVANDQLGQRARARRAPPAGAARRGARRRAACAPAWAAWSDGSGASAHGSPQRGGPPSAGSSAARARAPGFGSRRAAGRRRPPSRRRRPGSGGSSGRAPSGRRSSPSISTISHSGRVRSSRCEKKSAVQSHSSASSPGAGSAACARRGWRCRSARRRSQCGHDQTPVRVDDSRCV